nr:MAG TPA: exonuclease [Caudoviricetes sp.]
MITDNVEQRSLEWHRMRCGCITGSKVADIMKSGRKKDEVFSDTAKAYLFQVAGERMFNPAFLNDDDIFQDYIDQVSVNTKAMQWGTDQEDAAKALYMQINFPKGEMAELSSCKHDTIPYFAASPDGAIYVRDGGDIKIIEVKCPNINTYMKYRTLIHDAASLKETEPKYYWQMMAEMSCTGAKGGVFIVYCPWLSKPIHWAEIERVEDDINLMEQRVILANDFVNKIINS